MLYISKDDKDFLVEQVRNFGRYTGAFTLSSGAKSQVYYDIKRLLCDGKFLGVVCRNIFALCKQLDVQMVTGPPVGGIVLASALVGYSSMLWPVPGRSIFLAITRNAPKGYGMQNRLTFPPQFASGEPCRMLIVDDVLTSGTTLREMLKVWAVAHFDVVGCVVVLDRQEGGKEMIEQQFGVEVHSLLRKEDIENGKDAKFD